MKMFFPLYNNKFKYLGLTLLFLGIILFLMKNFFFEIIFYIGFFIIAYSKERVESDYTNNIRLESFKITFGLYISWMIAMNLTDIFTSFKFIPDTFLYVGLPLLLYNISFYLLLYKKNIIKLFNKKV